MRAAIIVLAGTESHERHIFDGAGTKRVVELSKPEHWRARSPAQPMDRLSGMCQHFAAEAPRR